MSLSIKSGPNLPPAYKGSPETFKGTVFAVGEAQSSRYVEGHTGPPIPDTWKDGNPRMQVVLYVVGQSGKAMRMFVSKSKTEGSAWLAWTSVIEGLQSDSFESVVGHTFLFVVKTTYKPGGEKVAFREWTITEAANEDYRPQLDEEWEELPQGVLPTFYYPGFSPEERAGRPVAPAEQVATPEPAAVQAEIIPDTPEVTIYDDEIPF